MLKKYPIKGGYYAHNDKVYKVLSLSRATDEIILEDISDGKRYTVRWPLFSYGYERVLRIKEASGLINRHPRSIYRYESRGLINKPKCYLDKRSRLIRFYRMEDLLEMHELISLLHQGRPRKDHRVVNNSLPDIASFKKLLKEKYA